MCYEDFFSLFLDSITFFRVRAAAKVAKPVQDPIFRLHAMNPSMQASNRFDEGEKSRFGSARQSEERIFNIKKNPALGDGSG